MTEYHALERTSPKGGSFISRCIRCGKASLPMSAIFEECPNTREMTGDEALIELVAPQNDCGPAARDT